MSFCWPHSLYSACLMQSQRSFNFSGWACRCYRNPNDRFCSSSSIFSGLRYCNPNHHPCSSASVFLGLPSVRSWAETPETLSWRYNLWQSGCELVNLIPRRWDPYPQPCAHWKMDRSLFSTAIHTHRTWSALDVFHDYTRSPPASSLHLVLPHI